MSPYFFTQSIMLSLRIIYTQSVFYTQSVVRGPWSVVRSPQFYNDLFKNSECVFRIWSGVFEFRVRFLKFRVSFFEFGVVFLNSEWGFGIWSEVQEFEVRFLNSEWGFWIRSDVFEFGVMFLNSEWGFGIRSEVQEFGVGFRIRSVVWHSEYTCGPPYRGN